MTSPTITPSLEPLPESIGGGAVRRGDRIFRGLSRGAGILILVIMASIGLFLLWKAVPALRVNTANFFTENEWFPDRRVDGESVPVFGISALLFGTVVSSVIALILAVPIGFGVALFLTFYAHEKLASMLGFIVDLLAAVPSIVFGLWGLQVLMPRSEGLMQWLDDYLGFIPIFDNTQDIYTKSIMIASLVLAIMILPTVSAITREVFSQVPRMHVEAALALGATRWEVVRTAVFPFGKPGMVSAAMLGLGRALGETIAVALLLSASFEINWHLTEPGGITFASLIALRFNEAGDIGRGALIAAGLVLFILTLAVNTIARLVIERRREFSGAN